MNPAAGPKAHPSPATGSVLVGLLWCLALLSIVVIGVLHTARTDLQVGKNFGDRIQAHYLAVAGIEKAKALLYHDARERSRTARNHTGSLFDSPQDFRDVPFGRGSFSVIRRARPDEGGNLLFGVSDEESRLNLNTLSAEDLGKIELLTPDIAAAIVDWRDSDNLATAGGAEADYYVSLQPPYQPRNGPFESIRELLMVRGVSRELLLGQDRHLNGLVDLGGEAGRETLNAMTDLGWAGMLTVDSRVDNVNAAGETRVNVQTADETTLSGVRGITIDIARAIVAYRGQRRLENLADLLDVTAAQNQAQSGSVAARVASGQGTPGSSPNQPAASGANPSGPKVISENLFLDIADEVTTQNNREQAGLVNVNTASVEALACLPGMNRDLAQAIVSYRQSSGFLPNIAYLLRVPGLNRDLFRQLAPRLTARSETFRILCEGRIRSSGTRQRVQEIVHVGLHNVTTLSYREDDL